MKGLILSGGKGTRLRPITYTNAKQLVPVANKPVLVRVIETLIESGITDLGIVVGDTAPQIKDAVRDGSRWGAKVTYIHQDDPLGLAHAVKISQGFLKDDSFVMVLGDNVIQGGIAPLVERFAASDWNAQIVLTRVEHPELFGVAVLDNDRVVRLVEKPRDPPTNLAVVGIYMFDKNVFEAVHAIQPSWRGELEITDAIQYLIEHDYVVYPYVHEGWWIDTGKMEDMLDANRRVLEELDPRTDGFVDSASRLSGRVIIEQGAEIINSVIRGPAIIGEHTRIVNSYIGPFTSIYHHCEIVDSEVEHCIILEHCQVFEIDQRIEDSLIGRHVQITRSPLKPRALKFMLGDYSKVGILSNSR
jgi:glucose-1-phosphate thymidylyltransferase